jgi:hypothetical protein
MIFSINVQLALRQNQKGQISTEANQVRRQRRELALDQQTGEIVGEMIADSNRYQTSLPDGHSVALADQKPAFAAIWNNAYV